MKRITPMLSRLKVVNAIVTTNTKESEMKAIKEATSGHCRGVNVDEEEFELEYCNIRDCGDMVIDRNEEVLCSTRVK